MENRNRADNALARYGIAVLAVLLAGMAWVLLAMVEENRSPAVFLPAVLAALFYGGVGAGYLAAILSMLAALGLIASTPAGFGMSDFMRVGLVSAGLFMACALVQAREKKIRDYMNTLNAAMAAAIEGVIRLHPSGRILDANEVFAQLVGTSSESLRDRLVLDLVVPEDRDRLAKAAKQCWADGKSETDVRILWRGAAPHDAHFIFVRSDSPQGKPVGLFCFVKDIAKRNKELEDLRLSRERLEVAFRHGIVGMTVSDGQGRWLEVNPAFCEMIGYPAEELIGRDFKSISHPDDLADNNATLQRLREGEIDHCVLEKRYISRAGQIINVRVSMEAVHDEGGKPAYFVSQVQELSREQAPAE